MDQLYYAPAIPNYARAPLWGAHQSPPLSAPAREGSQEGEYVYALVDDRANHIQIGLAQIGARGLQISHQPLENVHYLHAMEAADRLNAGKFQLFDGRLTRRIFQTQGTASAGPTVLIDGVAYAPERIANAAGNRDARPLDICLPANPAAALMVRVMHREVFGDPRKGSETLSLPDDGPYADYVLVVRHDRHTDRVAVGLSPMRRARYECEFRELMRFSARQVRERQLVGRDSMVFEVGTGAPDLFLLDDEVTRLVAAVDKVAANAWGVQILDGPRA